MQLPLFNDAINSPIDDIDHQSEKIILYPPVGVAFL
jgi:hypothetical protein